MVTTKNGIEEMRRRIVARFDPDKIILFGSHGRGQARTGSDVDLLIVMNVKGSVREMRLAVRRLVRDIAVPKDIIITTPKDFEWRKEIPGTIERPASIEGEELYART